ncbi:MAG TPA: excinuclease ABC subunit A, partial [Chitinophagales bacterium]|nr:excinuclease ABC subunit A [Chitinophagales bacterium]
MPRGIYIKGARQHNLKNITVNIPRNALVVVTGVSGSGKSSLVIDTLFAEGQRRYVESLSAYARQFLGRMNQPEVDDSHGLSPAIAIEQRVISNAARSTVGTLTEIYDYLRLLYARLGKTYSPVSGQLVRKDEVSDIVDYLFNLPNGERVVLAVPLSPDISKSEKNTDAELNLLLQKGYSRLWLNNTLVRIEDVQTSPQPLLSGAMVMIDRFSIDNADNDLRTRCADSVNLAFYEGHGHCTIIHPDNNEWRNFSNKFEADGLVFEEPSPQFFHFNNPYGACQTCEGFGQTIGIDENLVIPDHSLSVYEGAIAPWKGEKMGEWLDFLVANSSRFNFPIHRPIAQLTPQEYQLLWTGNKYFEGINAFFKMLQENSYKMHYRIMMAKYRGRTICPDCLGSRLRKEVQYVKIGQKSLIDLVLMPISDLQTFFSGLSLNDFEQAIGKRILIEITHRLNVLINLGLGYITLNRNSATLSGGETQRIHLTRILGSNLTNALYILDEPSIGLHPRDTDRLVQVLQNLRALGNTVIVVEHEEAVMKAADYLIDIGPLAGQQGGEIVFEGKPGDLLEQAKNPENKSLTAQYLSGKMAITPPTHTRPPLDFIIIENASHHNLKNVTAKFPIGCFTVVTGVSGSGKTTLVKDILYPALQRHLTGLGNQPGRHEKITGYLQGVTKLEL